VEGVLSVFEGKLMRKIFGPKTNGMTVKWRKLDN